VGWRGARHRGGAHVPHPRLGPGDSGGQAECYHGEAAPARASLIRKEFPLAKGLDIPLLPLARRRIFGVKTVSSGAVNRTIPQDEFVSVCRRYQQEAQAHCHSMPEVVKGLWRCEGFATTFGKFRLPENTLNDERLPRECYGITHVGYGAASTEHARFDAARLHEIASRYSAPHSEGFVYEGMGSILRIYEPGVFKFMCGVLGLIPLGAPPGPDKTGFFAQWFADFNPEQQRLITHGYGRLVAFSNISVYKAIEEAMTLPPERVYPCVQGIAFAFAMMNHEEMPRLLENSAVPYPGEIRPAFQTGLVYGLVFCDWFAPGFLSHFRPDGPLGEKLTALARDEAARNLQRGHLLPFALENSVQ
jgi:hypothetical protein